MFRPAIVLLAFLVVACSAPPPTPTATPVPPTPTPTPTATPVPPTATPVPTATPTPAPPTPTPIPASELRRQGLTYTDDGELTCDDLDSASYVSVSTDDSGNGTVQTSLHVGLDFHVVVAQREQYWGTDNMEMIVMGEESYIRSTRTQPDGEITVLDDWMSPSPFPPYSNAYAKRCLDAGSYDASVVDPDQPHAQTTDEDPWVPGYAEVKSDWWGDEYGRPIRRVETWVPKAFAQGIDQLLEIEFRDYGAGHVIAAP